MLLNFGSALCIEYFVHKGRLRMLGKLIINDGVGSE